MIFQGMTMDNGVRNTLAAPSDNIQISLFLREMRLVVCDVS